MLSVKSKTQLLSNICKIYRLIIKDRIMEICITAYSVTDSCVHISKIAPIAIIKATSPAANKSPIRIAATIIKKELQENNGTGNH